MGSSRRSTITQAFSATITIIWKPEANFATSFTGRVRIQIPIATPVKIIDHCGVPNFSLVSLNLSGSKQSLAIANKNLDAASSPDRAPEIMVRNASSAIAIPISVAATASTKAKIGSSRGAPPESNHHSPSIAPIMMNVTITYSNVIKSREISIPCGRFFSGSLTSPPSAPAL